MDALYIVTVYVMLDDELRKLPGYHDDVRARVTGAEILTVAIVAARYFQNHHERALQVLTALGYLPSLSVSRFNRRLHALQGWLRAVLEDLRRPLLTRTAQAEPEVFVLDAFPLPVCKRSRRRHCRKVQARGYFGRCEAKQEWFYGFKLHWRCDEFGVPLACALLPASMHESHALPLLLPQVPAGAKVVGDAAYVSERRTAQWAEVGVAIIAKRYGRMPPNPPTEQFWLGYREVIEVVHSQWEKMGVQRLHAPTLDGFVLKVGCSVLAVIFDHVLALLTDTWD